MSIEGKPLSQKVEYDDKVVRAFVWAILIWGIVGMGVGLFVASQMVQWKLNFDIAWLSFGRLRALHTNAVIFAFAANAFFAAVYYSTPRLLKAAMFSKLMSWIHFWGWQAIILAAAITLPLGLSQAREYAELIWPIDIAVTIIWVIFALNFILTMVNRREKHLYVALWFYLASIIAIAILHIVNNLVIPTGWLHSYPVYSGVQDALVQWWYGHNAVGFLLTTPFLGMMYYFLPKAANRPIFSYRLSIIHFWSLIFIYIWSGPHHLYYSALPDWLQTFGMVFSIALWMPSWGGMLNGLYTLRGAWNKVREEPVLKMFVLAVTAYGMATFEGPLLSIKAVNKLSHFTDWTIAHVHVGAMGWVGFMTFGMIYYLIPKLWGVSYNKKWANAHFWIGLVGILLYALSMWTSGILQPLMWFAKTDTGALLYPDFMESLTAIIPAYSIRAIGGGLYLIGALICVLNFVLSIRQAGKLKNTVVEVPARPQYTAMGELHTVLGSGFKGLFRRFHEALEGWPIVFVILTSITVSIGSLIEIIPMILVQSKVPGHLEVRAYTPLEQLGRDIYIREGCYNCHSQQVRPILEEKIRYGEPSRAHEYVYDFPFQFGSKRTGPDLHRLGKKYPDLWHYRHMEDPQNVTPGSIMPRYPWLAKNKLQTHDLQAKMKALQKLGVPYSDYELENGLKLVEEQAQEIAKNLEAQGGITGVSDREIIALIAYLQSLGQLTTHSKNSRVVGER